ncbi:MAG: hypothetical protein QW057_05890 [Candidatus Bathyarchaeia archaeon]
MRGVHGRRSTVERWLSLLKHGARRFYKSFSYKSSLKSGQNWMEAYAAIHNLLASRQHHLRSALVALRASRKVSK